MTGVTGTVGFGAGAGSPSVVEGRVASKAAFAWAFAAAFACASVCIGACGFAASASTACLPGRAAMVMSGSATGKPLEKKSCKCVGVMIVYAGLSYLGRKPRFMKRRN